MKWKKLVKIGKNKVTLQEQQAKFTHDVAILINYIFTKNQTCTFGDAYRTPEEASLNAQKGIGIKNSLHCKRLAVDLNLYSSEGKYLTATKDHEKFGIFWESLDPYNKWGGKFPNPDGNHYQRSEM